MTAKNCFDAKCLDLAIYFYPAASADRLNDLAQRIQNEVESEDLDASAPETPAAPPERTVWTKSTDSDPYCVHCGKTWDMHICDGRSSCPTSKTRSVPTVTTIEQCPECGVLTNNVLHRCKQETSPVQAVCDRAAHLADVPTVPKGQFWRGVPEWNRHQCRNCGEHYDKHLHTDEASTCPQKCDCEGPQKVGPDWHSPYCSTVPGGKELRERLERDSLNR
jgi:hypothetical protein